MTNFATPQWSEHPSRKKAQHQLVWKDGKMWHLSVIRICSTTKPVTKTLYSWGFVLANFHEFTFSRIRKPHQSLCCKMSWKILAIFSNFKQKLLMSDQMSNSSTSAIKITYGNSWNGNPQTLLEIYNIHLTITRLYELANKSKAGILQN